MPNILADKVFLMDHDDRQAIDLTWHIEVHTAPPTIQNRGMVTHVPPGSGYSTDVAGSTWVELESPLSTLSRRSNRSTLISYGKLFRTAFGAACIEDMVSVVRLETPGYI